MRPLPHSLALLAAAVLLTAGCRKQDIVVAPPATAALRPLTAAETQTVGSANDFAYRAFGALRQAAPDDNMFISPLSLSAALTMAYNGAGTATKTAMRQTLGGFGSLTDLEINQSYQGLFGLLRGADGRVTFTAANSLWYAPQYPLAAPFVQLNQTYFGATVQSAPFGNPAAAAAINAWASANTQGKVPQVIQQTTSDDVLYLLNALYFKAPWSQPFDPALTAPAPFGAPGGPSRPANLMQLRNGRYRRYHDGQQQVIDLPYGNRRFSMTFVVPEGRTTLAAVAARLSRPQLATWLAAADTATTLDLYVPRFRLAYEQELIPALDQLGMGVAFGSGADFGPMLASGRRDLAISTVKHVTYLEVNEEGSEAAAVTAVGVTATSVPSSVRLDRPFIFLIREKATGVVLFMGQLTQP